MNLQIDRTKAYTSGEWVRGSIVLNAPIYTVEKITVELQGVLSRQTKTNQPAMAKNTSVYTVIKEFDTELVRTLVAKIGSIQYLKFELQFPGHECDDFMKLPASITCLRLIPEFELRHIITVSVKRRFFAKNLLQSVELEFMPSANINLLLEPNVVHQELSSGEPQIAANISIPRFLAQGNAVNTVSINFPDEESAGYKLLDLQADLEIHGTIGENSFISRAHHLASNLSSGGSAELSFDECFDYSPAFSLSGVKLWYDLVLTVTIIENANQSSHEIKLCSPVEILPTLLYRSHCRDFALPNEIEAMAKVRSQGFPK